jgi:hypothetical protein
VLSVDIMFIKSAPFLVAVATPLGLVLAVSLKTTDMEKAQRTAVAVREGLDNMAGTMSGQGFSISTIYSDGEGAVGKLKNHLHGMGIERKIQIIKERLRAQVTGRLPFTLTARPLLCFQAQLSEIGGDRGLPSGGFLRREG